MAVLIWSGTFISLIGVAGLTNCIVKVVKAKKSDFGLGTLWKYAQTVGPAYLGAPTHPGKKKEVKDYSEI